jgi:hypothetical protein
MRKTLTAFCAITAVLIVLAHADVVYPYDLPLDIPPEPVNEQVAERFPGVPPNADILKYRHRRAFWPPHRWRQGQRVIKIRYRPYPGVYPHRLAYRPGLCPPNCPYPYCPPNCPYR